jgi:hypothetical protein
MWQTAIIVRSRSPFVNMAACKSAKNKLAMHLTFLNRLKRVMQGRSCNWVNSIGELVKLHSAAHLIHSHTKGRHQQCADN